MCFHLSGRRGPKNEPVKLPKKSCKRPKSYEHVINPSLQFWEIPIGGYEKWGNKKTYWDLIDGDKYDAFLLLTKNYVKGQMTWLSGLLKERGIPHIIIRTGIDEAIETSYKKYPLSHNAERIKWNAIKFMRESYVENGGKNDVDTNFYVIGSMHPEKYRVVLVKFRVLGRNQILWLKISFQNIWTKKNSGSKRRRFWSLLAISVTFFAKPLCTICRESWTI